MRTLWNPSTGTRRHEFGVDDAFDPIWERVGFHLAPGDVAACEIAERRAVVWTRFTSIGEMREWTAGGPRAEGLERFTRQCADVVASLFGGDAEDIYRRLRRPADG